MDVMLGSDGQFGIGMFHRFKYKWLKGEGLSVWSEDKKSPQAISVTTNYGDFVEVVNKAGEVIDEGGDGGWFYVKLGKEPVTLRQKKLPDPGLSKKALNDARETVRRCLLSDSPYSAGVPDKLTDAIAWMQAKLAEIPKAARDSATLDLSTSMSYGETYSNIEIEYREPETDEEVIRRVQIDRERARIRDAADRAKLASLKRQFEGASPPVPS